MKQEPIALWDTERGLINNVVFSHPRWKMDCHGIKRKKRDFFATLMYTLKNTVEMEAKRNALAKCAAGNCANRHRS